MSRRFDCSQRNGRMLTMEFLEDRTVLNGAPTVVDLQVSSTAWSTSFINYLSGHGLGAVGYRVPVGSSAQSNPLPWKNLDQIVVTFSEDVNVRASHLAVTAADVPTMAIADFYYDAFTHVATWTLANSLHLDDYQIDLDGDGIDPIKDLDGHALDGEWGNDSDTYASGNGVAGGDFEFHVNVLPGDVTQSGVVDIADYLSSYSLLGLTILSGNYNPLADFNGNGALTSADLSTIISHLWDEDPDSLPFGVFSDAPSASQIATVLVNGHVNDVVVPLWDSFADAEDEDAELEFAIESTSNAGLFDYVEVDSETGELAINAAWGASGRSSITVSATDRDGVVTETTFYVDVNYVNLPPVLTVWAEYEEANAWTIRGYVSDADDYVRGMIVTFSGAFQLRATVQDDGTFMFSNYVDPEDWGMATAFVVDPHGLSSTLMSCLIFPT